MLARAPLLKKTWFWPIVIAVAALVAVFAMLDPTGDHPGGWQGPGLTVDELFNVAMGMQLADRILAADLTGFRRVDAQLPDHPPLGRIWIGLCHEASWILSPPIDTVAPYSITCARTGPAIAFAATVFLVGWFTSRWFGARAGSFAALSVVLMPRTFGHAHLAALESCINLAYAAVVLFLADCWGDTRRDAAPETGREPPRQRRGLAPTKHDGSLSYRCALAGGILLGLAFLTKIQAVLLPIPVALWTLALWRRRAIGPLLVLGVVGGLVLFAGWPYLWSAPIDHLQRYLGRTTDRAVIYAWYQGAAIADRDLPWHYPWVMWGTTIPVGLHLLGWGGLWHSFRVNAQRARVALVLGCLAFPLLLFSVPGIAVYDGERLFSVSFPLWAVLAGVGANWLFEAVVPRLSASGATIFVLGALALQSYGLFATSPCWLSYYNLFVGGLSGAERLGLPVTYWGDGVLQELLEKTAKELPWRATIAAAPVLHADQWEEVVRQSPALAERQVRIVSFGTPQSADCELLLFFNRREYLPEEFRKGFSAERLVAEVRRDGVLLAGLYRLR